MSVFVSLLRRLAAIIADLLAVPLITFVAIFARVRKAGVKSLEEVSIVWGSTPIINNSYWSRSMTSVVLKSETFVTNWYAIYSRQDFDRVLSDEFKWASLRFRQYLAFCDSLLRYDLLVTSFDGFFLSTPLLSRIQAGLLKLAGVRIVVIPYGGDSYVYRRIRSVGLQYGLFWSYPKAARRQKSIAQRVEYWTQRADVLIPGFMGPDGFGRCDVPIPSPLFIDTEQWSPKSSYGAADARHTEVTVCHAPNHRGFKGTEFVVDAVATLRNEGLKVRLLLLEGVPNSELRRILKDEADILVEQLVFTGHGLNGLEGMATGLVTISNLEDAEYLLPSRRWAYFSECPLVSATPETITDVLRQLVTNPELRQTLGKMGRQYVEKYHGLDSSQYLFKTVVDYVYGRRESLMDLYHPLTSPYVKRRPRIEPPLILNGLPDLGSDRLQA